jgi:SAM-dependent methyltransferase
MAMNRGDTLPEFQVVGDAELPVSEACLRNQQPIADVLATELDPWSVVLEIGSGTGQHAAFITQQLPRITWQPSDIASRIAAINAWRLRSGRDNFLPPLVLDISQDLWPVKQVDAVFASNVVHCISWPKVRAMLSGIGRVLRMGGLVIFYGPYNYGGKFTSDGNRSLDEWVKREYEPHAGIKDFEQVVLAARREKLKLIKDIAMPANNRMLVLKKYI